MNDLETDVFGRTPWLTVGDRQFHSRLLIGVEQYTDPTVVGSVLEASGADVFITTYDLEQTRSSLLLSDLDRVVDLDRYTWIGTTSFSHSAADAVETCRRLRDALGLDIIKLDVRDAGNSPDPDATVEAAGELIADGFTLMPFIKPDAEVATALESMGCVAVRLMASDVAGYRGIVDPDALGSCIERLSVPAVVEGGLGSPADVVRGFELGADAVLVNTLVARAAHPARMAAAVRHAALAGGLVATDA